MKKARAYPRREGRCPDCDRWLVVIKEDKLPRHLCKNGEWTKGKLPSQIYPDCLTVVGAEK